MEDYVMTYSGISEDKWASSGVAIWIKNNGKIK
jgi:hypothetical protein